MPKTKNLKNKNAVSTDPVEKNSDSPIADIIGTEDVAHVEEKVDDVELMKGEVSDEYDSEEGVFDEEELNPFGDKWEQ